MADTVIIRNAQADSKGGKKLADWSVHLVQVLFLIIVLFDCDAPFLSAHNERQNQSFDMARHVFRDGWSSVLTPKVSYVFEGYENLRYTAVLQEFPFHGLIGWPLVRVTSHERAVTRLISTAFSLLAIQFLYWILRYWLPPAASAMGTAVWAIAPLVLHFGQTPMPDILCTTGILAAFWYALQGKLPASSGCFLFAILAKVSVIVFGLPILVALLIQRQCRSPRDFLRLAICWGWLPLLGIVFWTAALYHFAPPTRMTVTQIMAERGNWKNLVSPSFYGWLLGCLFPFGIGVLGFVGLLFAARKQKLKMDGRIKWAIIISNAVFFLCVIRKMREPQYMLTVLPWAVIAATFGFNYLIGQPRAGRVWRIALGAVLILHLLVTVAFTVDLKASRVPSFADIERAAQLLPTDARVIILYRFYGASPAVWLDRNVLAIGVMQSLESCAHLRQAGFAHLLVLDIDTWHNAKSADGPLALATRMFQALRKAPPTNTANLGNYTNPAGPFRQYCDQHFSPLFVSPHVVLYSIPAAPENGTPSSGKAY